MSDEDEIERAERARLAMLDAVHAGIERRAEVLDAASNANSSEDALLAVQQLLGLTEEHAQAVLDLQFLRLTRSSVARIEQDRKRLRAEWE